MALNIQHLVYRGAHANLPVTRENAWYLCSDTKELYFGDTLYTESVRFYNGTANKPASPAQGVLYIDEVTGKGEAWDGSAWKTVIAPLAAADNSVTIGGTVSAPTVGVKLSSKDGNRLTLSSETGKEGLYVDPADDPDTYKIEEAATADAGYLKTYVLNKYPGGDEEETPTACGKVNIPKDFLVKSGEVKTVTTADDPYTGAAVGDKYIDFVVNVKSGTATDEHIYLPVNDLADVYTAGNGIDISDSNVVSVRIDATNTNGLSADANGLKLGLASTSAAGAMSAADKTKLDGVSDGANKVEASTTPGSIKIDGTETVVAGVATTSANGLMSSTDKTDHDALVAALTVGEFPST